MIDKKIYAIQLVFENCEYVIIPAYCISRLLIDHITIEKSYMHGHFSNKQIAGYIALDILDCFKNDKSIQVGVYPSDCVNNPFDRIQKYNDITSIHIVFVDYSEDVIYTYWNLSSNEFNHYQSSQLFPNELLRIIIKAPYLNDGEN